MPGMRSPLYIRDRPWAFGAAVALLPVGLLLVVMSFVLVGNPRLDETAVVARGVGVVLLVAGALLAWRGRRVRLEGTVLRRGGVTERSLASAGLVVLAPTAVLPDQCDVYLVHRDVRGGRELIEVLTSAPAQVAAAAFLEGRQRTPSPVERLVHGMRPPTDVAAGEAAARELGVELVRVPTAG